MTPGALAFQERPRTLPAGRLPPMIDRTGEVNGAPVHGAPRPIKEPDPKPPPIDDPDPIPEDDPDIPPEESPLPVPPVLPIG